MSHPPAGAPNAARWNGWGDPERRPGITPPVKVFLDKRFGKRLQPTSAVALSEVRIEKPADLRDIAWTPAYLTLANGGETVGLIPTRYPGSEKSSNPALVMARGTEWTESPGGTYIGLGQRLLATNEGEHALMDIREIKLDSTNDGDPAEPAPEV